MSGEHLLVPVPAQRRVFAALRGGASLSAACDAATIDVEVWQAACEADPGMAEEAAAAPDPSHERGRWTCPGRHCGSYQGYKYGCQEPECAATVKPYKATQRAAKGSKPRTAVDDAVRARILIEVRRGASLTAACAAVGITPFRLDAALVVASVEGGLNPPLRPVRRIRCPEDCGTIGYRYGCRQDACSQAHAAAISTAPSRQHPTSARRFLSEDAEAVLEHLRAGHTIVAAARLAGWSYDALPKARKLDPTLDAAVIAVREQARRPGEPGDHARAVSRISRASADNVGAGAAEEVPRD